MTMAKTVKSMLTNLDVDDVLDVFGLQRKAEAATAIGAVGLVAIGAVIGAGAALLFAPQKGVDTRNFIGEKLRSNIEAMKNSASETLGTETQQPRPGRNITS